MPMRSRDSAGTSPLASRPSTVAAVKSCFTCGSPSTRSASIRERVTIARPVRSDQTIVTASRSRDSRGRLRKNTSSRTCTAS